MSSTVDEGSGAFISTVHSDILQTHILTRLDGPTLASAACASSTLHALSTEQKLWTDICHDTWPSTTDPRVHRLISAFPSGHRSFFSDSFPSLDHHRPSPSPSPSPQSQPTLQLISAVDIRYQDELIFSKLQESETQSGWFLCSPFRVDLLDPKESAPTPVKLEGGDDTCRSNIEKNLTMSWVVIDPTRKRAANFSSLRPVSVQRHWLTGDVEARYATILAADQELVQCVVMVTCGGKEGGELHVKEASLQVEDMDGKTLSGKDSLVILQEAMGGGRRKGGEGRERYEKYLELKRERRERKQRREKALDMVCIATGVTIFLSFWALILFR